MVDSVLRNTPSDRPDWCPAFDDVGHERSLAAEREKVRKLREALLAARVMWDRGPGPRKLDEALSWRANEEKVDRMVAEALIETADKEG